MTEAPHPLAAILIAAVLGGVLSCALAAVALSLKRSWVNRLVALAVGAMLGAAFLDILPHAFETGRPSSVMAYVLAGILVFFILEKLVIWRHSHDHGHSHGHEHAHSHAHHGHASHTGTSDGENSRAGILIVVGDTFHNFADGVLIAGAFLADFRLGVVTSLAIILHEIPQEVGDFLVLIDSGMSRSRAFIFNMVASAATVVGGVLGYFALSFFTNLIPAVLGFAAASMIYVAVADLIPNLQRKVRVSDSAQQIALIALGVLMIWGLQQALHLH